MLSIVFRHETHRCIFVDQERVLGILFPVRGCHQILIVDNRLLILFHSSEPHVKLVLDLDYLKDLGKDVLEDRDVTIKSHGLILGSDFADEIDYEHDQLVRHQLFLIFGAYVNVLQTDGDHVNQSIRVLDEHFHLHLVDGLGTVNDEVSQQFWQFIVVADWQEAFLLLFITYLHDQFSFALQ